MSEHKWLKKNGRVVSQGTNALFEDRAKEYRKEKPTAEKRKAWNKRIQNACLWVTKWIQKIEQADNRGDTKAIYAGVKSLSGSAAFSTTKPTEKVQLKTPTEQQKTDPSATGAEINENTRASGVVPKERNDTARASREQGTIRASSATTTARASGEFVTARASGAEIVAREVEADVRASVPKIQKTVKYSTRISGPTELAQV